MQNFNRLKRYLDDNQKNIVIFTAFQDNVSYDENIQHNKYVAAKLKQAGFGYFFVQGSYPQLNEIEHFIVGIGSQYHLINVCHKLAMSYNQKSIIVKRVFSNQSNMYYLLDDLKNKNRITDSFDLETLKCYYAHLREKPEIINLDFEYDEKSRFLKLKEKIIKNAKKRVA